MTSPSSQRVVQVEVDWLISGWIEQDSVQSAAQPPSAFTARWAALAPGFSAPAPVHCGTW